ncbi:MAG: glycosyltransferase family 4 protein [Prolixibacteraceae bacterium]|nr:glycosyltransferase family 4 protein [Burkholderiales bacterium]
MSAPRIALIRQKYNPAGGAERFVSRAIRALVEQGADITLITREWDRDLAQRVVKLTPWYLGSTWRDWGFSRAVCRHLQNTHYDLVQSHERLVCCDVFRAGDGVHREWLTQRARTLTPLRRLAMYANPRHAYVLHAERQMFASPRLRVVICNSRMVKEELVRHYALREDQLTVVYNGVDLGEFSPRLREPWRSTQRKALGIAQNTLTLLHVGSGFERKGVGTILRAMARVSANCHLIIVGGDKLERRYKSLASELGILSRVHFAGVQDPKPFYAAADAFVMASLYEPFANASMEALAMGLPVVTSTKSGAAEILEHNKTGYVCDALDIDGFSSAIDALANHERRLAMGSAARTLAESFTVDAMTRQLLDLYQRLLAGSSA